MWKKNIAKLIVLKAKVTLEKENGTKLTIEKTYGNVDTINATKSERDYHIMLITKFRDALNSALSVGDS